MLAVTLLTHFSWFALDRDFTSPDTLSYLVPAEHLLEGKGFTDAQLNVETRRTPGFPLLIALFRAATLDLQYLVILQHLLYVGLGVGLLVVTQRITKNTRIALVAGLYPALDPASVVVANRLLSETLFTMLIFGVFVLCYKATTDPRHAGRFLALAGSVGGASAMVRPISLFYFIPIAIYLLLTLRQRRLDRVLLFTVCFLLLPTAWAARNYARVGVATVSSLSADSLLSYRAAGVLALGEPGLFAENLMLQQSRLNEQAEALVLAAHGPQGAVLPHAQKAHHYRELATSIIRDHPFAYLQLAARGIAYTLLGGQLDALTRRVGLPAGSTRLTVLAFTGLSLFAALAGLVVLFRTNRNLFYLIVLTISYFLGISAGAEAYSRFRVPFVPMYAIAMATGVDFALNWFKGRAASRSVDPRGRPR